MVHDDGTPFACRDRCAEISGDVVLQPDGGYVMYSVCAAVRRRRQPSAAVARVRLSMRGVRSPRRERESATRATRAPDASWGSLPRVRLASRARGRSLSEYLSQSIYLEIRIMRGYTSQSICLVPLLLVTYF